MKTAWKKAALISMLLSANPIPGAAKNGDDAIFAPETQQISSERLAVMLEKIRSEKTNIHSLLVKRNDSVILDAYFYPFRKGFMHDLASVTKSITSLLIGIAIDKGFIPGESQKIIDYFPEYRMVNESIKNVRIKDLLDMASGFSCSWNDGERELHQMMKSRDWTEFMLNLPFSSEPGASFAYCSGNYYLLSEIIQRSTKMSCHQFASRYLFGPLEIQETHWLENDKGVIQAWGDLFMTPYDLSKIGTLLIHDGAWHESQIVSKNWISKLKPQHRINNEESYGYGWWFEDAQPDKIEAIGRGGQRLIIYKELKLVIVLTGGGYDSGEIDNDVLESIADYHEGIILTNRFNQIQKEISAQPEAVPDSGFIRLFENISGREFCFDVNDLELSSVTFEVRNHSPAIIIKLADGTKEEHSIGMNNRYDYGNERELRLPIAVKGEWIDQTTLLLEYNELCRINRYRFTFKFGEGCLEFGIDEDTENIDVRLKSVRVNCRRPDGSP